MFAFIEHGQPHNHHGGENTITLSHASVRRPCQKLTKNLTPQVRASKNNSTLGRRSLRPPPTASKSNLTNSCGEIRTTWAIKAEKQSVFHRNLEGDVGSRHVYENGSGPKRNQSHSSILWSGRRESNPRHQLGRLGFYH